MLVSRFWARTGFSSLTPLVHKPTLSQQTPSTQDYPNPQNFLLNSLLRALIHQHHRILLSTHRHKRRAARQCACWNAKKKVANKIPSHKSLCLVTARGWWDDFCCRTSCRRRNKSVLKESERFVRGPDVVLRTKRDLPRIFSCTTRMCWDKYWLLHKTFEHRWHWSLKRMMRGSKYGFAQAGRSSSLKEFEVSRNATYPPTFWFVCCAVVAWAVCTVALVLFLVAGCGCSIIWICVGCWVICWTWIPAFSFPFSFRNAAYLSRMIFRSAGATSVPSSRFTVI